MEGVVRQFDWSAAIGWILGRAALIALLFALSHVLRSALRRVVPGIIKTAVVKSAKAGDADELAKRYHTLSAVTIKSCEVVIWLVFAFMALSLVGIPIAPVLAGASVAGIAVGFGAQTLVRDVLSGLFILLEDQYRKGDVVTLAGIGGYVEDVNLRRTVLRDLDGTVHNIPNGEVRVASNLTRDWSRVNLNVSVAYGEDLDRVTAVINRVGEEMAVDPVFGPLIVEAPKVLRVDAFEDSGIAIKILGVTKPIKQWEVMGELRKRLKRAFDEEGIEIPFPHRVLLVRGWPPPHQHANGDG